MLLFYFIKELGEKSKQKSKEKGKRENNREKKEQDRQNREDRASVLLGSKRRLFFVDFFEKI